VFENIRLSFYPDAKIGVAGIDKDINVEAKPD